MSKLCNLSEKDKKSSEMTSIDSNSQPTHWIINGISWWHLRKAAVKPWV